MSLRNLSAGATGADVKAVQKGLNVRGCVKPQLGEDGVFGPKTDNAVRDYQGKCGLIVDGIVGAKTRKSLFPIGVYTVTVVGRRNRKLTSLWPQQQPSPPSARFAAMADRPHHPRTCRPGH